MNSVRRPTPPEGPSRSGPVPRDPVRPLPWAAGCLLLACLAISRPVDAQSLGLGFATQSAGEYARSSLWVGVSLGLHGSPGYAPGVTWTRPGYGIGQRYRTRGLGSRAFRFPAPWPGCRNVMWGTRHGGIHRCLPPQAYGLRWWRPAFAWARYPLPVPYGGHSYFGYGVPGDSWSLGLHVSRGRPFGCGWVRGWTCAAAGYGHYPSYGYVPWGVRPVVYVVPGRRPAGRSDPRALRSAASARVGSGGWVSQARPRRDTGSPSARVGAASTASQPPAGRARPATRRALSRSGPITNQPSQPPTGSNVRRASPRVAVTPQREAGPAANARPAPRTASPRPATPLRPTRPAPQARSAPPSRAAAPQPGAGAPRRATGRSSAAPSRPQQVLGRSGPRSASPPQGTGAPKPGRRTAR